MITTWMSLNVEKEAENTLEYNWIIFSGLIWTFSYGISHWRALQVGMKFNVEINSFQKKMKKEERRENESIKYRRKKQ